MRQTYSGGDLRRARLSGRPRKGRMMELDEITYAVKDGFAEIVLDRPDSLNPLSARPGGTRDQILHALDEAGADPTVGAVVLRGSGRAFSAGGDLTGNKQRESAAGQQRFVEQSERFHAGIRASSLPLIAAVHGYCLGAAVSLAAACDFVIAADSARFGVPEGRMGLIGATPLVPVIGRQWAKFLIMTGELIDARQACRIGLVLAVVPDHVLVERCHDLARRLARMPPEGVTLNKRAVDAAADAAELPGSLAGRAHRRRHPGQLRPGDGARRQELPPDPGKRGSGRDQARPRSAMAGSVARRRNISAPCHRGASRRQNRTGGPG